MKNEMPPGQESEFHIIVPAAGSGQRFGGPIPKQYMELCGKPIIQNSLERLFEVADFLSVDQITVAVSDDDDYWQQFDISNNTRIRTISGGDTRAESVQNALKSLSGALDDDWVIIHDAVRPLVSVADITKMVSSLSGHDTGGLLATPVYETVKRANLEGEVIATEDRNGLWIAQTPQMFRYGILMDSLNVSGNSAEITDEASAIEASGHNIRLVSGSRSNIKITQPEDLEFAELILGHQQNVENGP